MKRDGYGLEDARTLEPGIEEWDEPLPTVKRWSFADKVYTLIGVFFIACAVAGIVGTIITSHQPQYLFGKPRVGLPK